VDGNKKVIDMARQEAKCPLCGERIRFRAKPWIGYIVDCPACDASLEVVELKPLSLDWPYDDSGYLSLDYEEEGEINIY
jgi:lysine biosynthesis protein LysW